MSWRDRLTWGDESNKQRKKASFRNATFFVRDVDRSIGRKNIVHQYPFKDDPYVEDLGRDTDDFVINGYVVQNNDNNQDYIDERDALIEALRKEGPGTLIHPYYGELTVAVIGKARISESFSEGGIARFTMTFIRVLEEQSVIGVNYPKSLLDYIKSVDDIAEQCLGQSKDSFGEIYNATDVPDFISTSIMNSVDSLNLMLKTVSRGIQASFPAQVSQSFKYLLNTYSSIEVKSIEESCDFADDICDMFNGLRSITGLYGEILSDELLGNCSGLLYGYYSGPMSAAKIKQNSNNSQTTGFLNSTIEQSSNIGESLGKTVVSAILLMNSFGETKDSDNASPYGGTIDTVIINSAQRATQSASLVAITNLSRVNALVLATRNAVRINYSSYDSAIDVMNSIVVEIDDFLLKLGDDSEDLSYDNYGISIADSKTYNGIENLRSVFVDSMKGIGAALPVPYEYEIPTNVLSSLELAYDKYFDLDKESEIIEKNLPLVKHPGFLPSGSTINLIE